MTKMVPESTTVVVPTVKCRPVTETVSRQVAVCVPYQVPVTVMTTQMQTVAQQVPVTPDRARSLGLCPGRRVSAVTWIDQNSTAKPS